MFALELIWSLRHFTSSELCMVLLCTFRLGQADLFSQIHISTFLMSMLNFMCCVRVFYGLFDFMASKRSSNIYKAGTPISPIYQYSDRFLSQYFVLYSMAWITKMLSLILQFVLHPTLQSVNLESTFGC